MQGSFLNFYFSVFCGEQCEYITERTLNRTAKELAILLNPQTPYGVGHNIKGDVDANSFIAWTRWGWKDRGGYHQSWSMSAISGSLEEVDNRHTKICISLSANYLATIYYTVFNIVGVCLAIESWHENRNIYLILLGAGLVVFANSMVWLWAHDSKFFLKKTFEEGMELKPPVPYI